MSPYRKAIYDAMLQGWPLFRDFLPAGTFLQEMANLNFTALLTHLTKNLWEAPLNKSEKPKRAGISTFYQQIEVLIP